MSLPKMIQPSVAGTRGGATTLLYVVLIVALWLSITGRAQAVRAAVAGSETSGPGILPEPDPLPGTGSVHPGIPHKNPDGTWSYPGLPLPNGPIPSGPGGSH